MPTMKKLERKWMLMPLVMALLVSACSAQNSAANTADQAASRATLLALGTVGLEGTAQAVDAEAAAQLLPLWEVFADLKASSTCRAGRTGGHGGGDRGGDDDGSTGGDRGHGCAGQRDRSRKHNLGRRRPCGWRRAAMPRSRPL